MRRFHTLWRNMRSLLYPRYAACSACGAPLEPAARRLLCPDCQRALHPAHPPTMPAFVPQPLSFWASAVFYGGATRRIIHRCKYSGLTYLAPLMADVMAPLVPKDVDLLVPIPLHLRRERARGFNQSRLLAQHLSAHCGVACDDALIRTRFTRQQARLTHRQRRRNLHNAMQAQPCVFGKRVLIIDDVLTTGSTALEAARALRDAGAAWVGVLTFAKA